MTMKSRARLRQVSNEIGTWEAAIAIMEALNTAKSLSVAIQLRMAACLGSKDPRRNELIRGALSVSFDPSEYACTFRGLILNKELASYVGREYQATKLLSKIDAKLGVDREATALERFMAAEERCRKTNWRFSQSGLEFASTQPQEARWLEICFRAKSKIARILGRFDLDRVVDLAGYGPGVTLECRKRPIHPAKISSSVVFSPNSWRLLSHVIGSAPLFMEATTGVHPDGPCCMVGFTMRDDDELTFVPKSWKTDRTICIGSSAAIYLQKGIGQLLRSRLKRAGVDLDDQSHNQKLAEQASREGGLATVDLESASDTVSRKLVEFLLPSEWFRALNAVRASFTTLPSGERLFLEKFSAMGNGATFELESLIFFALVRAFSDYHGCDDVVSVYGDDIVVSDELVPSLIPFLEFCGFATNREKTFWTGDFRESCGKDFIYGYDVRPFFLKKEIRRLEDYFKLANQIRHWTNRRNVYCADNPLRRVYGRIYHCVSEEFRYRVPPSYPGDSGFHSDGPPCAPKEHKNGFVGWYFRYSGVVPERLWDDSVGALASKLMTSSPTKWWDPGSPSLGNTFERRARGESRRSSRMGYTFDWS